jgi:hypothetical protein
VTAEQRARAIADLDLVWAGVTDLRFGQMLRTVIGDPLVRSIATLNDAHLLDRLTDAIGHRRSEPGPPGPYWDTEARRGRTFLDGMPRDPARIPLVLEALRAAWDAHPKQSLGEVVVSALEHFGIRENEYNSRVLVIEDGALREALAAYAERGSG